MFQIDQFRRSKQVEFQHLQSGLNGSVIVAFLLCFILVSCLVVISSCSFFHSFFRERVFSLGVPVAVLFHLELRLAVC